MYPIFFHFFSASFFIFPLFCVLYARAQSESIIIYACSTEYCLLFVELLLLSLLLLLKLHIQKSCTAAAAAAAAAATSEYWQ